jgi:hypothetical protein
MAACGSENGKSTLLLWLNMLGWQVDVRRKGDEVVGVARHVTPDGASIRVGGSAPTLDELAFKLFDAALRVIERRTSKRTPLAA